MWQEIERYISDATGSRFEGARRHSVGGGSINDACVLDNGERSVFVKTNAARFGDMFAAEAAGLQELATANAIRVPEPIVWGEAGDACYLVMENLQLGGRGSASQLGEQLAAMHRHTAEQYGWFRDNTIGATQQINGWHHDWIAFYRDQRLAFQLELAARNGFSGRLQREGDRLLQDIEQYFSTYRPVASLLHGDLWSGNFGYSASGASGGEPVIFDPAVYYGDREADIAMTELFGGFSRDFYAAYEQSWPLDSGYQVRKDLYNLYHILNHLNLFGGGYLSQAESLIGRLLSAR